MDLPNLRRRMIEIAYKAQEGHLPSSLSVLDIIAVLYDGILGPDDKFILSKGHAALALYVVLAEKGIISQEMLETFCQPGSILEGHPNHRVPGVEFSTGSLGHGLPVAVGMALAKRIKGEPGRIYCLVGDGECEEGSVIEAARIMATLRLKNLTVIIDDNGSAPNGGMGDMFEAIGLDSWNHPDGHAPNLISIVLNSDSDAIRFHTRKGHGVAAFEAEPQAWHHRVPTADELPGLLESVY